MDPLTGINLSSAGTGDQIFDVPPKTEPKTKKAKTQTIDLNETRDLILACQQEAEEIYREVRNTWNDCWDAYRMYQDFSKKQDWQSKVYVPELNPAIKKATSMIRRIIIQAGEYFDIHDPLNTNINDRSVPGQKAALKYFLDSIKFDTKLMEGVESGFTFGTGVLKLWWEPQEKCRIEAKQAVNWTNIFQPTTETTFEEVKWMSSGLAARVVDPRQIYFDPEHSYIVEESMASLPDIVALSKIKMPDGSWYYDPKQVEKLKNTDYSEDPKEVERLEKLKLYTGKNEFKRRVHLYEYWGPVYNRKGEVLKKNARVVLANKQYILNTGNLENPMRFYGPLYGKPPYIIFSPVDFLFRLEGQSLIEGAISLQKAIVNITNMSLDGLLWKLIKLFEVNPDRLRNPDVLTKLRPGSPILVNGDGKAINEVQISDVPRGAMAETEILRRALQNSDMVTDFSLALETKKTTATEYEGANKQTDSMFESIGRNLEEGLIEPSIEMSRQLIIQFWDDFRDPALQKMAMQFGLPFAAQTREERIAFMLKTSWVTSRGISSYFEKMAKLKKIIDFFVVASKIPPLLERLKLREWTNRIIDCFSFERPHELVVDEQEEQQIQANNQAEKQAKMDNLNMQKEAFDMKKMEAQAKTQQLQGQLPPPQGMPPGGNGGGGRAGIPPEAILAALAAQSQGRTLQ